MMRSISIRLGLAAILVLSSQLVACCTCKHCNLPPPPPYVDLEVRECRHPMVAEVKTCLRTCASAPAAAKPRCVSECCGKFGGLPMATEAEKAALRTCPAECKPKAD